MTAADSWDDLDDECPGRETREEAHQYQQEEVMAVELEAAALYAVYTIGETVLRVGIA